MNYYLSSILAFTVVSVLQFSNGKSFSNMNALNGKHLRIVGLQGVLRERNSSGHIIPVNGPLKYMVGALSEMLNFSYSFLPDPFADRLLYFDDQPFEKGAVTYLVKNEADYVIGSVLGNALRFAKVDFPSSWVCASFGGILPFPRSKSNITAALNPLSYQVWVLIAIAILVMLLCLRLLSYGPLANSVEENNNIVFSYVIGNILNQGQTCYTNHLAIRVAAGAWCLGCFFLVQIYSSTLTSHLTAPNQKPIVNSFYEIADTPGVRLTVDRGFAIDSILMLQNIKHTGFMKRLSDMLRDEPSLRCNVTSDCLKKVKEGYAVFLSTKTSIQKTLAAELKSSNNVCDYTFMKETFWPSSHMYTALRKHSPYTETMSRGILRLREMGLIELWQSWVVPSSDKCLLVNNQRHGDQNKSRLSVGNLSSGFVLWLIGSVASFSIFIFEKVFYYIQFPRRLKIIEL